MCEETPSRISLQPIAQKSVPNISFGVTLVNAQPQHAIKVSQRFAGACITFLLLFFGALGILQF